MKRVVFCFGFVLLLATCQPRAELGVSCEETNGKLEVLHLGHAEIVHGFPYTVEVYLPPCYAEETDRSYPILYLFPGRGSNPTTWFAAGAGDAADQLIVADEVPPFIMVGLEKVEGDLLASNFDENIFPYIESHYRILKGARNHAIGGGSMGGAPSYRMAFRYPDRFGSAALFGSGIILGEEDRVRTWLAAIPKNAKPRVFLNTGFQDDLLLPRAKELIAILEEYGIEPTTIFSDGAHNYQYWVSNFPVYLKWLAEGW